MGRKIAWGVMTFLSLAIVLVVSRYLTLNPNVFFPQQRGFMWLTRSQSLRTLRAGSWPWGLGLFSFCAGCAASPLRSPLDRSSLSDWRPGRWGRRVVHGHFCLHRRSRQPWLCHIGGPSGLARVRWPSPASAVAISAPIASG